jgi:hypothetical protein
MIDLMAVPITFLLFRWTDIYMGFLCGCVYVKFLPSIRLSIMIKHEEDRQGRTVGEDRLLMLPRDDATYARKAAQQSQQQRVRNANALARARSAARRTGNR